MTPLTELKNLAVLQAKATDGPWTAFTDSYAPTRVLSHKNTICHVIGDSGETDDNAEYIAASRNLDLPALVAYVESLQNDIGKLVIQRESLKAALISITECGDEENEWDAVVKYDAVRDVARQALKQEG